MKLTHTLLTLLVCSTVVLAGCTGMGGLTGDSGGGADDGASAGGANGNGGADGSNGDSGGGSDGADANAGNDGGDGSSGSNAAGNANVELQGEDWLNVTGNVYVFEIDNATSGSGTATLEPPADLTGNAEKNVTVTYEGDKTFEQVYRSKSRLAVSSKSGLAERLRMATNPVLKPLIAAGIEADIDKENLTVGYEAPSGVSGDYTSKITGVDSYGGIECYATEVTYNGSPYLDTCIVPYKEKVPAGATSRTSPSTTRKANWKRKSNSPKSRRGNNHSRLR